MDIGITNIKKRKGTLDFLKAFLLYMSIKSTIQRHLNIFKNERFLF